MVSCFQTLFHGMARLESRCLRSTVCIEDAEMHNPRDRRKLTFYFKADRRVDFRELTKENFRIFKSRIWMSMVPKDGESVADKCGPAGPADQGRSSILSGAAPEY